MVMNAMARDYSTSIPQGTPISYLVTEDFIKSGPIFEEFTRLKGLIKFDFQEWLEYGKKLETLMYSKEPPKAVTKERIYHLYLPVYFWIKNLPIDKKNRPYVLGLSCPQGGGKTTIT